jgi:hypothetical protein
VETQKPEKDTRKQNTSGNVNDNSSSSNNSNQILILTDTLCLRLPALN